MTPGSVVKPLLLDSYLSFIKNCVGSNAFRNFYAQVNGKKQDVLKDGVLSCAFFVSSVLVIFGLIKKAHRNVANTLKDLEESGWKKVKKLKPGAIIVWEDIKVSDGNWHSHIGFYLGKGRAVSNNTPTRVPIEHHYTFHSKRKISMIYCLPDSVL